MKIKEAQTVGGEVLTDCEITFLPDGCTKDAAISYIEAAASRGEFVFQESLLTIKGCGRKTAAVLEGLYPSVIAFSLAEGAKLSTAGVGGREKATVHGLTNGIASAWGHSQD